MTVFLWKHALTYVSAPKVACTSLKHLFFEIENGRPFVPFQANAKNYSVHRFYPGRPFADLPHADIADHERLCAVRDPVTRLLSCYSNRVVHHQQLHRRRFTEEMQAAGLRRDPRLAEFIDRIDLYRRHFPAVAHHTRPLVDLLGRDPSWYHGIYPLRALDDFRAHVARVVGHAPALRHLQSEGPNLTPGDLSTQARRRIEALYAEDYAIWGRWL